MQEADALHIGDIICLLSASFLDANMILRICRRPMASYIFIFGMHI